MSGVQDEFLQPVLHLYVLAGPVALRQRHGLPKGFVWEAHSDGTG